MASLEEIASRFPKAIEELQRSNERAAADSKLSQSRELTDLRDEVRNSKDKRTREHKDNVKKLERMNEDRRESARKEEELSKTSAGQAIALKKELEENGKIAEDNKEFQKLSYEARKADYAQRIKNATSPAAKKEMREEARADAKKNGSRLDKIAAGIGGLFEMGKKGLKTAALGGMALLSTLAIGAMMIALGKFLQSDTFKKITKYISGTLIPKLKGFYEAFFGEEGGLIKGFKELFGDKTGIGLIVAGVLSVGALMTVAKLALIFGPLTAAVGALFAAYNFLTGSTKAAIPEGVSKSQRDAEKAQRAAKAKEVKQRAKEQRQRLEAAKRAEADRIKRVQQAEKAQRQAVRRAAKLAEANRLKEVQKQERLARQAEADRIKRVQQAEKAQRQAVSQRVIEQRKALLKQKPTLITQQAARVAEAAKKKVAAPAAAAKKLVAEKALAAADAMKATQRNLREMALRRSTSSALSNSASKALAARLARGAAEKATQRSVQDMALRRSTSSAVSNTGILKAAKTVSSSAKIAGAAGKSLAKGALKAFPVAGLISGLFFGTKRALGGDFIGAGLEIASGIASVVPVAGTAASIGIEGSLVALDLSRATAAAEASKRGAETTGAGNFDSPIVAPIQANQYTNVKNSYEGKYNQVLTRNVELNRGMAY